MDEVEYLDKTLVLGCILYTYCVNNPIVNVDYNGNIFSTALSSFYSQFMIEGANGIYTWRRTKKIINSLDDEDVNTNVKPKEPEKTCIEKFFEDLFKGDETVLTYAGADNFFNNSCHSYETATRNYWNTLSFGSGGDIYDSRLDEFIAEFNAS